MKQESCSFCSSSSNSNSSYYEKNKDKVKEYYLLNKERIIKRTREYQDKKKEEIAQKKKEYDKQRYLKKKNQTIKCKCECTVCGCILFSTQLSQHKKTKKHIKRLQHLQQQYNSNF
jgi:phage major head subunit gpT-like protein